ncbi:hypothetical protein AALA94_08490 [Lactococcus taiwanensis]|uniref:hypothetical protein n=2 Tax=Lactococcus taiwanensis TaxID=1151742 RepID=UPI0035185426
MKLSKVEKQSVKAYLAEEEKSSFTQMTFEAAERLFKRMSETLEADAIFPIQKIELVFNQDGQSSTENELFLNDFELDCDYQNILKPLSEAMFNLMPFAAVPFEDKLDYLQSIFEAWQKSTGLGEEHLPLLPDFEWEDERYVEVTIPYYQKHVPTEGSENLLVSKAEETSAVTQTSQAVLDDRQEVSQEMIAEETQTCEKEEKAEEIQEKEQLEIEASQVKEVPISFSSCVSPAKEALVFKAFEVPYVQLSTSFSTLPATLSLLKQVDGVNEAIARFNERNKHLQKEIFEQNMTQFDHESQAEIAEGLQQRDRREALKKEMVESAAERYQKALAFEKKCAKDKKNLALLEAKNVYEAQVNSIEQEYVQHLDESIKRLKIKSRSQLEKELSQRLAQEKRTLEAFLSQALKKWERKRKDKAKNITQEIEQAVGVQQRTLIAQYQKEMKVLLEAVPKTPSYSVEKNAKEEASLQRDKGTLEVREELSTKQEGEKKEVVTQEVVPKPTQKLTQEITGRADKRDEEWEEAESNEETHFQKFQVQMKQEPLLTCLGGIALVGFSLLSFSGGWMFFEYLVH